MTDELGIEFTVWTARLMVAAYLAAVLLLARSRPKDSHDAAARLCWTGAWLLLVVHVVCAFHFVHHWSQGAAWEHTAKQTREVTGLDWGGGLVVNYVFLAWWTLDVVAWWFPARFPWRRSPAYQIALHAAFAFLIVNATVVFGPPFWKLVGSAALLLLALARWSGSRGFSKPRG